MQLNNLLGFMKTIGESTPKNQDLYLTHLHQNNRYFLPSLKNVLKFISTKTWPYHSVIFAGPRDAQSIVAGAAFRSGQNYVGRWAPGIISNWDKCMKQAYDYEYMYKKLLAVARTHYETEVWDTKDVLGLKTECVHKSEMWGGLFGMTRPMMVINLNSSQMPSITRECIRTGIPVVNVFGLDDYTSIDTRSPYSIVCDTVDQAMMVNIANLLSEHIHRHTTGVDHIGVDRPKGKTKKDTIKLSLLVKNQIGGLISLFKTRNLVAKKKSKTVEIKAENPKKLVIKNDKNTLSLPDLKKTIRAVPSKSKPRQLKTTKLKRVKLVLKNRP